MSLNVPHCTQFTYIYNIPVYYANIVMYPSTASMSLGKVMLARNFALCSALSCHRVTKADFSLVVLLHVDHRQVDVALLNSTDLCLCNLYLKHFNLFGSPRRCVTGALSPTRMFPCCFALSGLHWSPVLSRASRWILSSVESGC